MDHNWIHDKELAGIDAQKLQTLASLSEQGHGLGQKELHVLVNNRFLFQIRKCSLS